MISPLIRKNQVSIIIISLLALGLLGTLAFWVKEVRKRSVIRQEFFSIKEELETGYSTHRGSPPSEELIKYLNRKKKIVEENMRNAWDVVDMPETLVPEEIPDPLGFKDTLMKSEERIRKTAWENNLFLPDSLGFESYKAIIPPEERISYLVKQLVFLEDLVNMLMQAGVARVEKVDFLLPRDVSLTELGGDAFYREFPFSLSVVISSSRLGGLINLFRNSPYILIIDKFSIRPDVRSMDRNLAFVGEEWGTAGPGVISSTENRVSASMTMSMIVFLPQTERPEQGEFQDS